MIRLADRIVGLSRRMLPDPLQSWGEAAAHEARNIEQAGEALAFAFGCLAWAVRETTVFHITKALAQGNKAMNSANTPHGSRGLALLCAVSATGLGLLYMSLAGAPAGYLMMNVGAFAFGLAVLASLALAERRRHLAPGVINLAFGVMLLGISLFGVSADGVTRWVALGPVSIQPSLVVLPLMLVLFARSRDRLSLAGLALAALALALQPDRAMAGALVAGAAALALTRPDRNTLAAAAIAAASLAATLVRADLSPAVPYVDRILYSSFAVHPLAGLAVALGSALLIAPVVWAYRAEPTDRPGQLVFGGVWSAIILAAALGNYPTPLVGYGGSAVVGYLLSLIAFPSAASLAARRATEGNRAPDAGRPLMFLGAP